jgi:hypothetical protein
MLLIELLLECSFDFTDLFGAEVILDPADHDFLGQISVGNHVAGFRLLQPNRSVRRAAVGAVFSVDGVMHREHHTVRGVVLHVGDGPGKRCHRCGFGHGGSVIGRVSNVKDFRVRLEFHPVASRCCCALRLRSGGNLMLSQAQRRRGLLVRLSLKLQTQVALL